jgi:hypothetical protein
MADVLSVIQDVLNQDKQQKKEHAKMMREVQKKLKEKDSEEVTEKSGDKEEYQKFVTTMLKKFGVKSPAELAPDKKKEFYDALDAGWEGDDEKPEPGDKKKEEGLGDRVKSRMKAEQEEEEEDEDEAPVGDQDNPDTEPEEEEEAEEPSEEEIDKIADLVVQKLKDKADEEEDEEEQPEPTEAEAGEEEEVDTKPKMESFRNPHARDTWAQALRKVYSNVVVTEGAADHLGNIPEPITPVVQSFGKKLSEYAKKQGGIDKADFMKIAKNAMAGKLPQPKGISSMDTDPRDLVYEYMAKEFGWMFVEDRYGITFKNKRDFVESTEIDEHKGTKPHKHPHEDVEIDEGTALQVKMALDDAGLKGTWKDNKVYVKKSDVKKAEEALKGNVIYKGKPPIVVGEKVEIREGQDTSWIDPLARKVERKWKSMNKSARKKWLQMMADKAEDNDTKQVDLEDVLDDYGLHESYTDLHGPGEEGTTTSDTDKDYGLHQFSDPKYVPAYTDKSFQTTPDKTGIGQNSKPTQSGTPKKAKGNATAAKKPMPVDAEKGQEEPATVTKSGTPNKAKGKATAAKIAPRVTTKNGVATQKEDIKDTLERWGIDLNQEGYMIMPGIDRERYTEMRGMEGPFMTKSGKVVYYDPKAGEYYDRDSDIYLSYTEYLSLDQETSAQKAAMKQGVFADPKSKEFKKMIKDKAKAEKAAKKQQVRSESLGMTFARKYYKGDKG